MAKKRPWQEDEPPDDSRPKRRVPRPIPQGSAYDAMMKRMFGDKTPATSPRLRAEALVRVASQAEELEALIALARQALQVWPDCAEAYILLAEQARSPKQTIEMYEQAVAAGERDLGLEFFADQAGRFWVHNPARAYMRARLGLAQALWVVGKREETVAHYQELIRLNRNDNQGVRYNLAAALLELGRDDALAALFEQYPDDESAAWVYSTSLLAFRIMGDTPETRKLRSIAVKNNPHVPEFMTGEESLPADLPKTIIRGDKTEAVDYAIGFMNAWRATPGALAWLGEAKNIMKRVKAAGKAKPKRSRNPAARGPTMASKKRLNLIPLEDDESWQMDARRLPVWIKIAGELCRPWVIVVASRTRELILGQSVLEHCPSAALVWDTLARAIESPGACEPHRPARVRVTDTLMKEELLSDLESVGISFELSDELDMINDIFLKLSEHVSGRPVPPGLLEMPAVSRAQVAGFFEAAASFYRDAPWKRIGGGETIKVECDRFDSGPWYAVIIGQMGMTLGLALYEDLEALIRMRDADSSDEQNARDTVALSITFGNKTELPVADLDAAEHYGWEIADSEAYPAAIRKERGMMIRPPLSWELLLMEGCMLTLPEFVTNHDRDDFTPEVFEAATHSGPLRLAFHWVEE